MTEPDSIFSVDKLLEIKQKIDSLSDPIREMMVRNGYDPAKGGILFLPESLRNEIPSPPYYVRFSILINSPVLLNSRLSPFSQYSRSLR